MSNFDQGINSFHKFKTETLHVEANVFFH
uniref:Uncharacterized protein n=1 Tax=Anguilla anguilla TaxID=7936 RepID=A0A0E9T2H1_ANGAN